LNWLSRFRKKRGLDANLVLDNPDIKIVQAKIDGEVAWFGYGTARRSETVIGGKVSLEPGGPGISAGGGRERELDWFFFYNPKQMGNYVTQDQIQNALAVNVTTVTGNQVRVASLQPWEHTNLDVVLASGADKALLNVSGGTGSMKVNQGFSSKEIFAVKDGKPSDLWNLFSPDQLKTAREGLNSILPEGSANSPHTLWVTVTSDSHAIDLKTLASRLGCALWVDTLGTISR
jgi:hypothetical protein